MPISVIVADDQAMVRDGIAALLDAAEDISVVAQAADGREAVRLAGEHRPDVVVMDVRMPAMDGLEATRRITSDSPADGTGDAAGTGTKVLVLTTFDLDEYVYEALGAGASGFLLKDAPVDDLRAAVRTVARGDALLAPSVTKRLIADIAARRRERATARPEAYSSLTPREADVLRLVARGLSNGEIAEELVLSEQTVKTHVGRILMKLGLRDRTQAVVFAYENGVV
ncbi:response regulator transcription factor [Nocardiopsis sp. RSe5-2]|uniref:Response regulator transcription factor n=1 Tax=Nocardiopsis endophytica TaxID=3018445 RepID=A0ABT4TZE2_9ACTN|nr:response regulator transcription factor [Nocardiopsis endophytica]MDA2810052.1 response regulator transcription factor [Nocardiopsis endophytica]